MSMSRKNYRDIAKVLNDELLIAHTKDEVALIGRIAGNLAVVMKQDNPRFDIETFRDAVTTLPITKDDL